MGQEKEKIGQSGSQRIEREISEFFRNASFGGVKYQAFFDWKLQVELEQELYPYASKETMDIGLDLDSIYKKNGPKKKNADPESERNLRIKEFQLALIHHEIDQKGITLPGYTEAWQKIFTLFDALGGYLIQDSQHEFPHDPEEVYTSVLSKFDEAKSAVVRHLGWLNGDQTAHHI